MSIIKSLMDANYSLKAFNIATLVLRLGFGILMIPQHGLPKLLEFSTRKLDFMSFMGLGSTVSLSLAIFAELFCSILLILGLCTRLAIIPLLITTLVIMNLHQWEFFGKYELVPAFMFGYIAILLLGPGKYSLDAVITKTGARRRR